MTDKPKPKRVPRRRAAAKKPTERAIMCIVQAVQVLDEETGQLVKMKGIFPAYAMDRRALNEKGLHNHDMVMVDVFKDRNPRFWRLFHALSMFIADNVEAFEGHKAHSVLKQIQLDAKVHCELVDAIETGSGKRYRIWNPKSLNFNDTDEAVANEVWDAICDYVARIYFPDWDADQVAAAAEFWERQDQ